MSAEATIRNAETPFWIADAVPARGNGTAERGNGALARGDGASEQGKYSPEKKLLLRKENFFPAYHVASPEIRV